MIFRNLSPHPYAPPESEERKMGGFDRLNLDSQILFQNVKITYLGCELGRQPNGNPAEMSGGKIFFRFRFEACKNARLRLSGGSEFLLGASWAEEISVRPGRAFFIEQLSDGCDERPEREAQLALKVRQAAEQEYQKLYEAYRRGEIPYPEWPGQVSSGGSFLKRPFFPPLELLECQVVRHHRGDAQLGLKSGKEENILGGSPAPTVSGFEGHMSQMLPGGPFVPSVNPLRLRRGLPHSIRPYKKPHTHHFQPNKPRMRLSVESFEERPAPASYFPSSHDLPQKGRDAAAEPETAMRKALYARLRLPYRDNLLVPGL